MHPDLTSAIDRVYAVFGRQRLARRIGYCTHCVSDDEALILQSTPLRELTATQLERFTFKAMSTWGDQADFRYFLPRILELFATGEQTDDYLFVKTLSNVRYHGISWHACELDVIEQYLIAMWRQTLALREPPLRAFKILEAASENSHTIAAYLEILADTPGELAALHLAELVDELAWTSSTDGTLHRESQIWLRGGIAARILETAFLATDDPQTATQLGQALEQLDFILKESEQP